MIGSISPRSLGLAGVFFGAFTLAAAAQQQPPQPHLNAGWPTG